MGVRMLSVRAAGAIGVLVAALGAGAAPPADGAPTPKPERQLSREKTDRVFVVLVEFGDERHPDFPDRDTHRGTPGPVTFDGPRHNRIPSPDRRRDNTTIWQPDYSPDHYRQLYFGPGESLRTYFEAQSSGRYSLTGQVTDWVRVRYNQARYGRSNGAPCRRSVCANTWELVRDALDQWVADQHRRGRTDAQIRADLDAYDRWDRYDHDHDGDVDEPDGYVDHVQLIHAGADQADQDPRYGEDAIWSHRWKAYMNQEDKAGPAHNKDGGTQIGETGLWVADYTTQPENGGLSVVAHEYAHDLGLPDAYDLDGGDSPMEWWSPMSQSRLSRPGEGSGTRLADLGAWEKLRLGWLDYEIVVPGAARRFTLGPAQYTTADPQALLVVLPRKRVTTTLPKPPQGLHSWWSSAADDLDTTLARRLRLPAGPATLTFRAHWEIEDCEADPCDYAYVEVDDGSGWRAIAGSITNAAEDHGIDGVSKGWKPATFDLSRYAGRSIGLRFRYETDAASGGQGLLVDDVRVTAGGRALVAEGAEDGGAGGWTASGGFVRVTDRHVADRDHYYLAAYRTARSYDRYLQQGPYNFGWLDTRPDWVERFSYEEGLLVTYWDTSQRDNNTSAHPGAGRNLVIDAHPRPLYRIDGQPWRTRVQLYDAPFSPRRPRSFTLHVGGRASYVRGQQPEPVFDDARQYWFPETPVSGVKVPKAGVRLDVVAEHGDRVTVQVSRRTRTPSPSPSSAGPPSGAPSAGPPSAVVSAVP
ncbi:immune inhibitor A domain-containing protein [Cryptosporangium aurantiacum]|uniref:Immune inhibitor A n=1 Tax=Cryptosporangium aurantiacum TaxID=134849 RepID=A0A1M7QP33_9ACTN|nr:immune inhibitor A domain-containing protein [Cryptosporangium aurantiacum]SHN32996.1 immune inhibitor A [Cryptosporangium aurantiacum]